LALHRARLTIWFDRGYLIGQDFMKLTRLLYCLVPILALVGCASPGLRKTGEKAPMVRGVDSDGTAWDLSDDIGKTVVLVYFYPKDNTPGCTREACGFRDRMADLKAAGVKVVGVSFDDADSHKQFIFKYNLNFPLIIDSDGDIARAFHVPLLPGKKMDERVSFLIGLDGRIVHVTESPSADVHLAEMQAAVARLPKI
jgi:peroxiredoxin Q/BCP